MNAIVFGSKAELRRILSALFQLSASFRCRDARLHAHFLDGILTGEAAFAPPHYFALI